MPYRRHAEDAGIINAAELELLGRVFDRLSIPGESEEDREARASRIIGSYLAGITDEDELVTVAKRPLGR